MATPRRCIIDLTVPGIYMLTSRCVRASYLCGGQWEHRREWLEYLIRHLASIMAIDVLSYSILHNHFHVVVQIRPDIVKRWRPREIALRYLMLCPSKRISRPRGADPSEPVSEAEIDLLLGDKVEMKLARKRLSCPSFYMGKVKYPVSCRANAEDGASGTFWEKRFDSRRMLTQRAVLQGCVYVDLNPVRAGLALRIEDSDRTSIYYRVQQFSNTSDAPDACDRAAWLAEIPGLTSGEYLELVDQASRRLIEGKHSVAEYEATIGTRLGISSEQWDRFASADASRLRGSAMGSDEAMKLEAARRGQRWLWNVMTHLKPEVSTPTEETQAS